MPLPTVVSLNSERFLTHSHGPLQIWEVPGKDCDVKAPIEVGHHALNGKISYEHTFGMKKKSNGRMALAPWEVSYVGAGWVRFGCSRLRRSKPRRAKPRRTAPNRTTSHQTAPHAHRTKPQPNTAPRCSSNIPKKLVLLSKRRSLMIPTEVTSSRLLRSASSVSYLDPGSGPWPGSDPEPDLRPTSTSHDPNPDPTLIIMTRDALWYECRLSKDAGDAALGAPRAGHHPGAHSNPNPKSNLTIINLYPHHHSISRTGFLPPPYPRPGQPQIREHSRRAAALRR